MLRHGLRAISTAARGQTHPTGRSSMRLHAGQIIRTAATSATVPEVAAPPGDGPNHRSLLNLDGHTIRPYVQPDAFVAPSASVIGSVQINTNGMVGYGAVVRGDLALIHIGAFSWVGDNAILTAGRVDTDGTTASPASAPKQTAAPFSPVSPAEAVTAGLTIEPELFVGDHCTIGANAQVHGAYLSGFNVVGDSACIADGVHMEQYATVLPGSWVTEGSRIGEGEVWGGSPAVKVGEVSSDERVSRKQEAKKRNSTTVRHSSEFLPVGTAYWEKEKL